MSASWTGEGKGLKRVMHLGDTGWTVRHCGHGQAHRPWYIESPEGLDYVKATGGAWTHQAEARRSCEQLAAGSPANCLPMIVKDELAARQGKEDVWPLVSLWAGLTHAETLRRLDRQAGGAA